jgi:hypothetical protein
MTNSFRFTARFLARALIILLIVGLHLAVVMSLAEKETVRKASDALAA